MAAPISIADPTVRRAIEAALESAGELVVLIRYANTAGRRDWFVVRSTRELDEVLERVSAPLQFSHAVEVYASGEFPFRGGDSEGLRARALELIESTEVVVACKRDGDLELHGVHEFDEAADLLKWFDEQLEGERMVGVDPMTRDVFYPNVADAFLAYQPTEDGTIRLGAY